MANKILTPSTLWQDFDDSLDLNVEETLVSNDNGTSTFSVRFLGRQTQEGRVRIYSQFSIPEGNKHSALLILADANNSVCPELMKRFTDKGFAVLMPDYRGKFENSENFTEYPNCISYANFKNAERHLYYVDESAKETCWYEWVAVARFCIKYLKSREDIERIGVLGLKHGGEIAWQLMATSPDLSCGVTVCAGGWMAYRDKFKFGESGEIKLDEERHRFLAGVDSQAYAPFVKCPVMMLSATNDSYFDADRAFDTYARINPDMEKTFHFASRYDGHIGSTSLANLDLFFDKYLKDRAVFMPTPVEIVIDEDDDGELVAKLSMDRNGEFTECKVFMAQDNPDATTRNWELCQLKKEDDYAATFSLNAYENAKIVFAYAKAKYSCGFYVSSKIAVKRIDKKYKNLMPSSRILYSSLNGTDSFMFDNGEKMFLADCIIEDEKPLVQLIDAPCGIKGIYSPLGLKTYKISDSKYRPENNASLMLDLYSLEPTNIEIAVKVFKDETEQEFICIVENEGGGVWHNKILTAKDFKNEAGISLKDLNEGYALTFNSNKIFALNNLLWV